MKNEKISVRISAEQRGLLEALGGGNVSAGLADVFGRLDWLRQTLPRLTATEKQAVCACLVSTMWMPDYNGAVLAHEISDFQKCEPETAAQFDIDYQELIQKIEKIDRLAVFAIFLAKDAINGCGNMGQVKKYW